MKSISNIKKEKREELPLDEFFLFLFKRRSQGRALLDKLLFYCLI